MLLSYVKSCYYMEIAAKLKTPVSVRKCWHTSLICIRTGESWVVWVSEEFKHWHII